MREEGYCIGLSSSGLGCSVGFCLMGDFVLDSGEDVVGRCRRCMRVYLSCPCPCCPVFSGLLFPGGHDRCVLFLCSL